MSARNGVRFGLGARSTSAAPAGTSRLSTGTIDDLWSAGKVGLVHVEGTAAITFDDFRVGYDNNADNDIDDAGDDLQISDAFDGLPLTRRGLQGGHDRDAISGRRP